MEQYKELYGNNLLNIFTSKQTKDHQPILVIKDHVEIKDTAIKTYHYQDDFEKELNFSLPSKNRKTKQMISLQESIAIINKIPYGVLSFQQDDIPYSVAVNHIYKNNKLYFHCAKNGFKLNVINQRASYLVVEDLAINEKMATHNHNSVMIIGNVEQVDDMTEKKEVLMNLMEHLAPSNHKDITDTMATNTNILAFCIEYMHGKSHIR